MRARIGPTASSCSRPIDTVSYDIRSSQPASSASLMSLSLSLLSPTSCSEASVWDRCLGPRPSEVFGGSSCGAALALDLAPGSLVWPLLEGWACQEAPPLSARAFSGKPSLDVAVPRASCQAPLQSFGGICHCVLGSNHAQAPKQAHDRFCFTSFGDVPKLLQILGSDRGPFANLDSMAGSSSLGGMLPSLGLLSCCRTFGLVETFRRRSVLNRLHGGILCSVAAIFTSLTAGPQTTYS